MSKNLIVLSFLLSILALSSCSDSNPNKYNLVDTWGSDGNWGNSKKASYVEKDEPVEEKKVVKQNTATKTDLKPASEKKEKIVSKNTPKVVLPITPIEKPLYSVSMPMGWEKIPSKGSIKDYYVKVNNENLINFSSGVLKTMGESDLKPKFKENYIKNLSKKFSEFKVISHNETIFNKKESWELKYSFNDNNTKVIQKQIFVPHNNNIAIFNFTTTGENFAKSGKDFDELSKSIVFN